MTAAVDRPMTPLPAADTSERALAKLTALAASGNPGLTRHNPLERHFRDIQCCRVHPPQDDIALLAAGRRTLAR